VERESKIGKWEITAGKRGGGRGEGRWLKTEEDGGIVGGGGTRREVEGKGKEKRGGRGERLKVRGWGEGERMRGGGR